MTDLSSTFLEVEEPELDSIDFRQSLRFFQDQLILNGKALSPAKNNEGSKFNLHFTEESTRSEFEEGSLNTCRISIPTVDTILESVRVLRAIQKSQEQRGASWSLHVTSPDSSLQYLHLLAETQGQNEKVESKDQNGIDDHHTSMNNDIENADSKGSESNSAEHKDQNGIIERIENADQNSSTNTCIPASTTHGNQNGSLQDIVANGKQNGTSSYQSKDTVENHANEDLNQCNGLSNIHLVENKDLNQDDIPSFWPKSPLNHNQKLINGSINTNLTKNEVVEHLKMSNGVVKETGAKNGDLIETNEINKPFGSEKSNKMDATKPDDSIIPREDKLPQENGTSVIDSTENQILADTNLPSVTDNNEIVEESTTEILKISQNISDISQIYRISWDSIDSNHGNNSLNEETLNDDSTPDVSCEIKLNSSLQLESIGQLGKDDTKKCLEDEASTEQLQKLHKDSTRSPIALLQVDQLRPESVSDTNSSIYVSANCSPCTSLYETDDNELGYSNQSFDEIKQNILHETKSLQEVENLQLEDTTSTTYFLQDHESSNIQDKTIAANSISETTTPLKEIENHLNESNLESSLKDSGANDDSLKEEISVGKQPSTHKENELPPQQSDLEYFELSVSSALENTPEDERVPQSEEISYDYQTINLTNGNTTDSVEDQNEADIQITLESDEPTEIHGIKKFITSSWNLEAVMESLYKLPNLSPSKVSKEETFKKDVFVLSEGAFCNNSEGSYTLLLQQETLQITQESGSTDLLLLPLNYAEVSFTDRTTLKLDNKLGRCLYFRSEVQEELLILKEAIKKHCLFQHESDTISLVHYPLKCHQNVVIVDLGSCSTRAGILMDEPTLPFLFFPSVCATDKKTGQQLFGNEALQSDVRKNSILSFPIRPSIKIIKHDIDINSVGGLFKKVFQDLRVDPSQFSIQVCLPRSFCASAQNALVKFLLEDLHVKSVNLTHQALLTLYAHNVSTGIVVDIGDRMDILPVVDGFIVENGVTRLPHGGQRLIHHMKHALAEKHISLSNDIDAFVVQYITENLSYIAENYDDEIDIANRYPQVVKKTIALQTFAKDDKCIEYATLDDARFKVPEGLFKPELWGLDNPGIHKIVQKAIQGTGMDVRKKIAENIYVSGGVTLIPGFVERLFKEVAVLNAPRIIPKVIASNYRYHSTYIGACKFSNMDVFPNVCVDLEEYSKNQTSCLKKFVLSF